MTYYDLNMNSKRITSVQDPASAQDVATKNYVDTASGLVFISSTTSGSNVASFSVSNVFSSTYDNYKIIIQGGSVSNASGAGVGLRLGGTATGYAWAGYDSEYAVGNLGSIRSQNCPFTISGSNASAFQVAIGDNTNSINSSIEIQQPFLSKVSYLTSIFNTTARTQQIGGLLNNNTSYTGFDMVFDSANPSARFTNIVVKVYGYKN